MQKTTVLMTSVGIVGVLEEVFIVVLQMFLSPNFAIGRGIIPVLNILRVKRKGSDQILLDAMNYHLWMKLDRSRNGFLKKKCNPLIISETH
jgi:hypothetical protein